MLSIGKLAAGQESYYLTAVAKGVEDYYLGSGEPAGEWSGSLAGQSGLAGRVADVDLRAVLGGGLPDGTTIGREGAGGRKRLPGLDLTFSAPKSVSMLYGLAGPETVGEVVVAHRQAVAEAVGYLERNAVFTRRRVNGEITQVAGDGLLVAGFRHRTSRAGDPNLHTHCLVANATRTADGRWGALDGTEIYRHARTAGFVYQAVLRGELTVRLGVGWGRVVNGCAEIAGFDRAVLRGFSKRRIEVEERLAERGEGSAGAAQVAVLDTRRTKHPVEVLGLRERWAVEAAGWGWDRERSEGLTRQIPSPPFSEPDRAARVDRLVSSIGLTKLQATFDRRDVVRAWCEQLPAGHHINGTRLEQLADLTLADRRVVPLETGERRWSTVEMLAVEQRVLTTAAARRDDGVGVVAGEVVDRVLADRPAIGADQEAMIRRLCTSGAGVEVVVGKAGAGKTFALDAAREAWEQAGFRPVGVALAARAAAELQAGARIPSTTLASFLTDAITIPGFLGDRAVVVVDEAAMVDTRTLDTLLHVTGQADAKVVLVGDHRQLPSIGAGGTFRLLAERLDAVELTENRRQVNRWEIDTLDRLRQPGTIEQTEGLLDQYRRHGRLHDADDATGSREAMIGAWYQACRSGERVLMVASRQADVDALNEQARRLLVQDGTIAGPACDTASGRQFGVGDEVLCLRNNRRLGVLNGTTATITAIKPDTGTILLSGAEGDTIVLPERYVQRWLAHGYATTIHKAQGATVDRSLLLANDGVHRQAGYVALSRGRHENHLYVVAGNEQDMEAAVEQQHAPGRRVDQAQRVARSLTTDIENNPAIGHLQEPSSVPEPVPASDLAKWLLHQAIEQTAAQHQDLANVRETIDQHRNGLPLATRLLHPRRIRDLQRESVDVHDAKQAAAAQLEELEAALIGFDHPPDPADPSGAQTLILEIDLRSPSQHDPPALEL